MLSSLHHYNDLKTSKRWCSRNINVVFWLHQLITLNGLAVYHILVETSTRTKELKHLKMYYRLATVFPGPDAYTSTHRFSQEATSLCIIGSSYLSSILQFSFFLISSRETVILFRTKHLASSILLFFLQSGVA
jgi:hypothetical protein